MYLPCIHLNGIISKSDAIIITLSSWFSSDLFLLPLPVFLAMSASQLVGFPGRSTCFCCFHMREKISEKTQVQGWAQPRPQRGRDLVVLSPKDNIASQKVCLRMHFLRIMKYVFYFTLTAFFAYEKLRCL